MTSNTPYQTHQTLISVQELAALHASGRPLMVFDCSFDLTQPAAGKAQYLQAHVPGAVFADLDHDLSAKHGVPGAHGSVAASEQAASGGRHPLPNRERFAVWLSSIGFSNDMQAVVYDRNGANYCGRLWWMLQWAGHGDVAVLDGGLQAWQAAGQPVASGEESARFQSNFELRVHRPRSGLHWAAQARPWSMHAPRPATAGRSSRWTLWPATSRARSTGPSPRTSLPTAASSLPPCCARSSTSCWQAAIRPVWCTSAAAA